VISQDEVIPNYQLQLATKLIILSIRQYNYLIAI